MRKEIELNAPQFNLSAEQIKSSLTNIDLAANSIASRVAAGSIKELPLSLTALPPRVVSMLRKNHGISTLGELRDGPLLKDGPLAIFTNRKIGGTWGVQILAELCVYGLLTREDLLASHHRLLPKTRRESYLKEIELLIKPPSTSTRKT